METILYCSLILTEGRSFSLALEPLFTLGMWAVSWYLREEEMGGGDKWGRGETTPRGGGGGGGGGVKRKRGKEGEIETCWREGRGRD